MRISGRFLMLTGMLLSVPAAAENRLFIVANNPDGYGVDRCLASGEHCGTTVATAYCQSQSFELAKSFRKIDREEITGAIPTGGGTNACAGNCESFVAIECSR
jgi:hypothetical protein